VVVAFVTATGSFRGRNRPPHEHRATIVEHERQFRIVEHEREFRVREHERSFDIQEV
jgi:hypothetical protein